MLNLPIFQIGFIALVAICAFAYAKGGVAERYGAALICLSWLSGDDISLFFGKLFSPQMLEITYLVMDAALAVGFLFIALRFAKIWLGVAMLMQSGELALHGAILADWGFQYRQYVICNNLLSAGLLLLLATATVAAWMRRVRTERASSPALT